MISDFEVIASMNKSDLRTKLEGISDELLVKAYIGTAPDNAKFLEDTFEHVDFKRVRTEIGRISVQEVDDAQNQILKLINAN